MKAKQHSIAMKKEKTSLWVHLFFILIAVICIVPFIIVISASFSSETDLAMYGFSVLPKKVDFTAYKYLFRNPEMIFNSYIVTIITQRSEHFWEFCYVNGSVLSGTQHIQI